MENSIRKEIFRSSIVFSSLILIVFGVFFAITLYQIGMGSARDIIKQRNYAVNFFIDGFFSKANNTVEFLAADERIQNGADLSEREKQEILALYELLIEENKYVSYIYSGYENKDIIISDFDAPEGFDPTTRPWYQAISPEKPHLSTGLTYQDAITGEWLFSTGKALFSKIKGFTGVVSTDSSIEAIVNQLGRRDGTFESSYSFVAKPDGEIMIHYNHSILRQKISDIVGAPFQFDQREGYLEVTVNGNKRVAYYSHCDEVDWVVVTIVEQGEITSGITFKVMFYMVLTGVLALILGFAQSIILSKKFSEPLVQLKRKINDAINRKAEGDNAFQFPNNEIGLISKEISRLTSDEFYAKSIALQKSNDLLEKTNGELQLLSMTDQLTQLYNRHKIDLELTRQCEHSSQTTEPFSLLILDLDFFKQINDTFGHIAGDIVLQEVSALLLDNTRQIDTVGRWGGEEFMILCPKIKLAQASGLANRIRQAIANFSFSIKIPVTVSVGVAELNQNDSIGTLIKRADANLYRAKAMGRNIVLDE